MVVWYGGVVWWCGMVVWYSGVVWWCGMVVWCGVVVLNEMNAVWKTRNLKLFTYQSTSKFMQQSQYFESFCKTHFNSFSKHNNF